MSRSTLRAAVLALLALSIFGQDFRATITGQVTDQSGAAIAGAKVRAVQRSTNEAKETTTNHEGYYALPYLQPSTFDVEVMAQGFQKSRQENVTLQVADKLELPFKLEVGQMTQAVTVTADAREVIQTGDASTGLNFDSLMTSEFALNGRQVYMLMDLTPGVLFGQEDFGATGYSGTRGWDVSDNFTMNGGVKGSNSFSLNGAPISQTGMFQLAPNVDAIQEFKVMVNSYDSSIGRSGGGSVNTTLKSGSNAFHGTLFNFMRNSIVDANFTQNNAAGNPRGKHITNQFGGTLGGYARKDKDFFFVSFEGFRERLPFPAVVDSPPFDLRTGQAFTKYKMTVYDPTTAHQCVNGKDVTGTCDASGIIRDPFPGNVLPLSRISPIGQKILAYYPAPNVAGQTDNFVNGGNTGKYRYDQPMARWDRVVNPNNRVYALFTFQAGTEFRNSTGVLGPGASGNINTWRKDVNGIADWTRFLSVSAIFDLRASFGRFWQLFPNSQDGGVTAQTLGMKSIPRAPTSNYNVPPRIAIDQYTNLFGNGANLETSRVENQLALTPTVTVIQGKKTLKFGADFLYAGRSQGDIGMANGYLQFTKWGTQRYPRRSSLNVSDGSGVGDVLLGIPGAGQIDWNDTYYRTWPYIGFYVQNDWKLLPHLTLNLGLRYDVQFPWVERLDRVNSGFDFNAVNPLSDQIIANWKADKAAYDATKPKYLYPDPPAAILGGKTFVGKGDSRRIFNTDWTDVQPRIGVAWQFEKGTVLRTGFGIFHRTATQLSQSDGYSLSTGYERSLDGDIHPAAGLTGPSSLEDPFPNGLIQPTGSALGLLTNVGNAVTFSGHQRPIPRTFQYSFGLQRRLPLQTRLDVKYSGSITNHDSLQINDGYWSYDLNQSFRTTPAIGDTNVPNPFYGVVDPNRTRGTSATIQRRELMRSYPLFANVNIDNQPWARYRYDSLQMQLDKRFTGSRSIFGEMTMIFSYTFSKNMQSANYLNQWNFLNEKPVHELVAFDKPQNLSYSGIWDMPFGRKRHFVTSNKYADAIAGGWRINWVYRYISGAPIAGINAVNKCGTLLVDNQSHDRWWNNTTGCWGGNPAYQPRVVEDRYAWLREQENVTVNLAAAKSFKLTERWTFQLRGEAFNLMNRPIYRPAPTSYTDVRFGMQSIEQRNFPRNIQFSGKLLF
jgi:Carboxypeptidase regulatory-like domain